MKRKLDANDVPSPEPVGDQEQETDFEALNLDPRLRQALIKEKFGKPTLVQAKAIPLALEGKDILGECLADMNYFQDCTDRLSSRKDWLRKNCRLRPPRVAIDSATKI